LNGFGTRPIFGRGPFSFSQSTLAEFAPRQLFRHWEIRPANLPSALSFQLPEVSPPFSVSFHEV
jgi:hypothetical protein